MDNPKIVILDGFTANPGDLSWSGLEELGSLTVYDRTAPREIIDRAKGARIILTNKTPLDAATLEALPDLKYVGVLATGYNVVDTAAAARLGITVTNIPSYSTDSVAQLVFAFILALTCRTESYTAMNRRGRWADSPDFSYTAFPLHELAGKTLGIVGFGHIGSKVAAIGQAFGMRIALFTSRPQEELPAGYTRMELDELFAKSDVLSLHCPLTPDTASMVNARTLALMKPTAMLVNTGRGPLIDENALAEALRNGTIAGAGLDVLCQEPPAAGNPLFDAPNLIITPHIGWATSEARARLIDIAVANVRAFLDGTPVNKVN